MQWLVSGDGLFHLLVSEVKSHFLLPKRFENKLDDSVRAFSKSLKVIIHHQDTFHKRCNTGQETISYSLLCKKQNNFVDCASLLHLSLL